MGVRIISRLGSGVWMSMSLGDYVRGAIGWAVIFVVIAVAHDNWGTVQDLWFIGKQITVLCLVIWVVRSNYVRAAVAFAVLFVIAAVAHDSLTMQ